jgi:hypothetical protein
MGGRGSSHTYRGDQRQVGSRCSFRRLCTRCSESVGYDRNVGGASPDDGRDGHHPPAAHEAVGEQDSGPGRTRSRSCSRTGRRLLRCGGEPRVKSVAFGGDRDSLVSEGRHRLDGRSSLAHWTLAKRPRPPIFVAASRRTSSRQLSCSRGPLAHPEEQGTFNPKVPGSRPGRPTKSVVTEFCLPSCRVVGSISIRREGRTPVTWNSSSARRLAHSIRPGRDFCKWR